MELADGDKNKLIAGFDLSLSLNSKVDLFPRLLQAWQIPSVIGRF